MWRGRTIVALLTLGLTVGLLFPAVQAMGQQAGAPMIRIEGSITSLDLKAQPATLKLTDLEGKLVALTLDPQSTVFKEGRPAKLEMLQVGQKVRVEAVSKEGKQVAKTIEVLPGGAPAPSKPGSAAPEGRQGESGQQQGGTSPSQQPR